MTPTIISIILAVILIVLLGSGLWVAISLLTLGFIGLQFFAGVPSLHILGGAAWSSVSGWSLTPLPLFIWMGEILFHSRLSEDIFSGIEPWLRRLPGRLLHVNVFGSGLFAAVSGSSAATCATIGRISCPELNKRGYDEGMAIGSLTASGTLGLLIPPSITMIVYGVSAQVSIAKLFIAGIIPGLVLLAIFTTYIIIWALFNRQKMPPPEAPSSLLEKLRGSARLLSVVALILVVIGSIYAGIATPTEASAFGVVGAMLLSAVTGTLSWPILLASMREAVRTTCMIGFILIGASVFTTAAAYLGIPRQLVASIAVLNLSPYTLLVVLMGLFVIMGCFIDGISIVVLTAAILMPMVKAAGIDPLWFGIYLVIAIEMAQITPPVGFNLFVMQSVTGHDSLYIAKSVLPFFCLLLLAAVILLIFPGLVTWLPATMF